MATTLDRPSDAVESAIPFNPMDSLGIVAIGASCAAVGSLVTGYLLNLIAHRRDMRAIGGAR